MLGALAAEVALFALLVGCGYFGVMTYARLRQPGLHAFLLKRRVTVTSLLMLLVAGAQVFEDVLAGESRLIDERLLVFVHEHVAIGLAGFFAGVTVTGSSVVVVPAAVVATVILAFLNRRHEALLVLGSLATAAVLVLAIKMGAGRVRPALWPVQWYWDSSFPSGHTLHTAALSTALAICAGRLWPRCATWAMSAAVGWTALVALSRLVLGAHWPTDVLAAMCLGAFIPLAISLASDAARCRTKPPAGRYAPHRTEMPPPRAHRVPWMRHAYRAPLHHSQEKK